MKEYKLLLLEIEVKLVGNIFAPEGGEGLGNLNSWSSDAPKTEENR